MTKILLLAIACTLTLSGFAKNSNPTNKLRSFVGKNQVINNKMQQSSNNGYRAGIREEYYPNDTDNSIWVKNNATTTYTYDNLGNTTVELRKWWVFTAWENLEQIVNTYNIHNDRTESKNQSWQNNNWVTDGGYQNAYTYDANNKIIVDVEKRWNRDLGGLENSQKTDYTYSNNELKEITYSSWDYVNRNWTYQEKYIYVWYNFDKEQPLSIVIEANNYGKLETNERRTFTYTGNNYVGVADLLVAGNWEHAFRYTYSELDTYGSYTSVGEEYIDGNWVNSDKETDIYDSKKNEISYIGEGWISNAWVKNYEYKYIYTYDINNNITSEIYQTWDNSTQLLRNYSKYVYSNYQIILDVPEIAADSQINMFPNPTNGRFAIQFMDTQQKTENRKVEIYNMLGEKIYFTNLKQQTTNEIDLSKSPKGIYMVQVSEGAKVYNRKIVVQ